MAAATVTLTAPSTSSPGGLVILPDGSTLTISAIGQVACPTQFVSVLLNDGFTYKASTANGIVADTNANQANATPLPAAWNRITTNGAANGAVKLPAALPGTLIRVTNTVANSANVYPQSGEAITGGAANAAFALAANKTAEFSCAVAGQWDAVLTA